MKLTHSLKIVLLLAFTSLQMMGMEQKPTKFIFDAIGYYEQGKFEEAAEIFKRYAGKPVPVAEPFCLDLVREGFLSPFNPVPSHGEVGEKAKNNMYFVAAQHYRTLLKIEGKALMGYLEKHNYAENAPLLYLVGKIFETGTRKFPASNQLAKDFYLHALEKGDLRAVFGLKRVCPKEFNGMEISGLSLLRVYNMLTLMPKLHQDEGHIFAGLSCFFQNSPAAKTFPYFIYPAALFGHPGAQFLKGQSYCQNESQILYWMMQCAEHDNLEALSLCGHMMEQGKGTDINYEKAYGYLKRAAHHPEAKDIEFSNFAMIHEQGKGTPVNYQKACKWYGKAYEANSRSGQISKGILGLGEASENPYGVRAQYQPQTY